MCVRILLLVVLAYLTPTFTTLNGQEPVRDSHIPGSATLKMRVVFRGELPKLPPINAASDPVCANLAIPNERLIVGKEGALQNAALIWDEKKNAKLKVLDKDESWLEKVVELKFKDCRIEPHVLVMRAKQKVKIVLLDKTGHSPNLSFLNNTPPSFLWPAGQSYTHQIEKSEPVPLPIECTVHPWMKAHLIVKDHPYIGVSNAEGIIEIDNLPIGESVFRLWHESGKFEKVVLNGVDQAADRSRITFKLDAGLNDLGTIELQDTQFNFDPDKK